MEAGAGESKQDKSAAAHGSKSFALSCQIDDADTRSTRLVIQNPRTPKLSGRGTALDALANHNGCRGRCSAWFATSTFYYRVCRLGKSGLVLESRFPYRS